MMFCSIRICPPFLRQKNGAEANPYVYYQVWNRWPAQVGCMRPVLRAGALGRARGMGWRGRWEGGSGWGTHVSPWLIYVNVWQKPLQYCKVISLQLIKINEKKESDSAACGLSYSFSKFLSYLTLVSRICPGRTLIQSLRFTSSSLKDERTFTSVL